MWWSPEARGWGLLSLTKSAVVQLFSEQSLVLSFIPIYLRNIRLLLRCWFGTASECSRGRVRFLTAILMRWKCVPLGSVELCIGKDVPSTGGERWLCWKVTGRCWTGAETHLFALIFGNVAGFYCSPDSGDLVLLLTWLMCALGKKNTLQMLEAALCLLYSDSELASPVLEGGTKVSKKILQTHLWACVWTKIHLLTKMSKCTRTLPAQDPLERSEQALCIKEYVYTSVYWNTWLSFLIIFLSYVEQTVYSIQVSLLPGISDPMEKSSAESWYFRALARLFRGKG